MVCWRAPFLPYVFSGCYGCCAVPFQGMPPLAIGRASSRGHRLPGRPAATQPYPAAPLLQHRSFQGKQEAGDTTTQVSALLPRPALLQRRYFEGKRDAERRLAELYPEGGVALRPGAISGSRVVGTATLPLWLLFTPMKAVRLPPRMPGGLGECAWVLWPTCCMGAPCRSAALPGPVGQHGASSTGRGTNSVLFLLLLLLLAAQVLSLLPTRSLANLPIAGGLFVPPVKVEAVAKAAVSAVLDPTVPPGVMDDWTIINKYEK